MSNIDLLMELFCDWYNIATPKLWLIVSLNDSTFSELWTQKWFAKKEQQIIMDKYLQKYESLFEVNPDDLDISYLRPEYKLIVDISFMILWDQISRNIYRKTSKAYETDKKARQIVESVMKHWDRLPLAVKISCILVYIHSENIDDLLIVEDLMKSIKNPMLNYPGVAAALSGIAKNHRERMIHFGRIPERNIYLCRDSTEKELAYLASFSLS